MKKINVVAVVLLMLFLLPKNHYSQSQEENNVKKYWENRDRLRKFFLKIGPEPGESIPMNRRNRYAHNTMHWGDATSQLGWYFMVLATEYQLLANENKSTVKTENELYFAIKAFKRLDQYGESNYAEKLLNNSNIGINENGWFNRDDVPSNFNSNWSRLGFVESHSDYSSGSQNNFNASNEPSLDQVAYIMLGCKFIVTYVDPTVHPDPEGNGGFNLVNEAREITKRIMNRFLLFKDNKRNDFNTTWIRASWFPKKNYSFGNPVTGSQLNSNHDDFMFAMAGPLIELGQEITGENYEFGYKSQMGNGPSVQVTVPYGNMREFFYRRTFQTSNQHFCIDLAELLGVAIGMANVAGIGINLSQTVEYAVRLAFSQVWNVDIGEAEERLRLCIQENFAPKTYHMNKRFMYAICSGISAGNFAYSDVQTNSNNPVVVSSTILRDRIDNNGPRIHSLIIDVLNGYQVKSSNLSVYQNMLNGMPLCDGCYDFTENEINGQALSGNGGDHWSNDNIWLSNGEARNYDDAKDIVPRGNKPGLDYMILYNLYRLAMSNQINLPEYGEEVICPCKSTKFPEVSNSLNIPTWDGHTEIILPEDNLTTLNGIRKVYKYDFDYEDFNINLEKYLTKDINIQGPGKLFLYEDVKVCGNARMYLNRAPNQSEGELIVGNNQQAENAVIRFTEGTELHVQNGGLLNVQDNSRTIIEEGALLRIYPGASIKLDGPNAILEIRGKLEIMPGATFQTTGEGYVLFNIQNPDPSIAPFNVAASPTSRMVFETSDPGTPYKLVVNAGTILYPESTLGEFSAKKVGIRLMQDSEIILSSRFAIEDNYVFGQGSNGFTFTTLTFTPVISGNTFFNCKRTLAFIGRDRGRDVKIRYNTFEYSLDPILLYETSAHIAGNSFIECGDISAGMISEQLAPPLGGGYLGALRIELNRFQNTSALTILGAYYPHVDFCGNVVQYNKTNGFMEGWAYSAEKAHNTLKCNYFERQTQAVHLLTAGSANLSTQQFSFRSLGGGIFPNGGNNIFNENSNGLKVSSPNAYGADRAFPYAYIQEGQNSFLATSVPEKSSFVVNRQNNFWGFAKMFDLNANGNWEINGNYWAPLLSTTNYTQGGPANVIEENNRSGGYHFSIRDFNAPNFIVGTNTPPPDGCPILVWDDAVSDPDNFNPITVPGTGFNMVTSGSSKVYIDRPFSLDGQGFSSPPTNVGAGTFSGQGFYAAFNNGLGGMTETTVDENDNTVYIPSAQGLLDMADLLMNTAHHVTIEEKDIHNFGYKVYLQCLARAVALDVFQEDPVGENDQINAVLGVFTAIENDNLQYEFSEPGRFYENNFFLGVDKCHLYRLFQRYTEALTVLSSLSVIAQTKDIKTVDYLSCQVESEKDLFEEHISWIDYQQNMESCGELFGEYIIALGSVLDTTVTNDSTFIPPVDSLSFSIAPNPATSYLIVTIDMNVDAEVDIIVLDYVGSQLMTQSLGTLLANTQTSTQLDVNGLPPGTYTVLVYADGVPYAEQFIKL